MIRGQRAGHEQRAGHKQYERLFEAIQGRSSDRQSTGDIYFAAALSCRYGHAGDDDIEILASDHADSQITHADHRHLVIFGTPLDDCCEQATGVWITVDDEKFAHDIVFWTVLRASWV